MSLAGVASARRSSDQLARIVPQVDDRGWEAASACAGWRVIDVVAHLGALAHEAVDPPEPDPSWPENRERYHDMRVDERRGRSHAEVIEEWRRFTPRQLDVLAAGQQPPRADEPVRVPGLGTYPRHLLANTMAFNVLCHLRYDLLAPDGPLAFPVPAPDDALVAPAVAFMLAGIPQMQGPELAAAVERPLVLELTGPGATTVTVRPAEDAGGPLTVEPGAADGAAARVRSAATAFVAWGTTRTEWRDHCRISGDTAAAEPFLDRLDIV
ncbi:maleylpyruvate isomerase family mycothiol-dependent enzyme [Actinacidiphila rubida]|uniref:TIGR03083 family protein n=1 Tax=Actinacidiphila rubida TaxID=310780 RepID=A0A1H8QUJ4_9ACTN|nr:maleylpyruvate isomerase family mycothiol-dependent enzyme [Actinacidiphila rubida]SEO57706.1 TIGR03083 family protein [Actinacidiphila rubida]